ncbi:phostensin-like [Scyliorhinus canicula]|uniref:phostensin-like n=1 Tax=Scyliorhinus canicula TaxID=7830 RepID=UPI0018F69B93|nr:phostensin-like [Scyliorhinus canicula]
MSTLPQWKVQLLERKRRDEEEGRRREQEELERLARMPAWKREIIERRRARLCSGSSQSQSPAEGLVSGGGLVESQAWPNGPSDPGGSAEAEGIKQPSGLEPEACDAKAREGVVLQENISPLYQNHFIQQEKQRKEALPEQEQPLCSCQVIEQTTHRADNITIAEFVPECLENQGKQETMNGPSMKPEAGQLHIQSSLSRSVEDLNTFETAREGEEAEEEQEVSRQGRVSRLLFRFGQRGGAGGHPRPTRSRSTENIIECSSRTSAQSSRNAAARQGRRRFTRSPSPPLVAIQRCSSTEARPCPPTPQTVATFCNHFEAQSVGARTREVKGADSLHLLPEGGDLNQGLSALPARDTTGPSQGTPGAPIQATLCQFDDQGKTGDTADQPAAMSAAKPARALSLERPVSNAEDSRSAEQQPRADPGQKERPLAPNSLDYIAETKPGPALEAQAPAELRAHSKKSFAVVPHCRQEHPPEQEAAAFASSRPGNSATSSLLKPQPDSTASSSCGEQAPVCFTATAAASDAAVSCLSAAPNQRDTDNGSRDQQADLGPERPPLPELHQGPVAAGKEAEWDPSMSRLYSIKPPSVGPARTPAASPEEVRLPTFGVRASSSLFNRSEGAAQASPAISGGGEPLAQQSTPEIEAAGGQVRKGTWTQARPREGTPAGSESPPVSSTRAGRPAGPQRKSGKTITINPRKMATNRTPTTGVATVENGMATLALSQPAAGATTKKRYPTVEEIQVIGGYLTLQRSCLVKTSGSRGKLKISFNDCELESTFEYPSELALLAELGPDQDEEPSQNKEADEEEEVEVEALVRRLDVDKTSTVGAAIRRKPVLGDKSCR